MFLASQFTHKPVNLFFTIICYKIELTGLWVNRLWRAVEKRGCRRIDLRETAIDFRETHIFEMKSQTGGCSAGRGGQAGREECQGRNCPAGRLFRASIKGHISRFVNFWRISTNWLQERTSGSKNGSGVASAQPGVVSVYLQGYLPHKKTPGPPKDPMHRPVVKF